MAESYPMNGGDGAYSYSNNSHFQKTTADVLKTMIDEAIAHNLDNLDVSSPSTIGLADLGCSVGPNTFFAMQNAIETIQTLNIIPENTEFQVFFNDHSSNDFNKLFATLPPKRTYFAAGVPGSFHRRLFPKSSIHFVYSSFALQWLSRVPQELLEKGSAAWNKGRVHCTGAHEEVRGAYEAQYAKDMEVFFKARAEEVVGGGVMVLIMPAKADKVPYSSVPICVMYELLGQSLMDMANEGTISEDQVDSFNLPLYPTSPSEISKFIEENGCFCIEKMELMSTQHRFEGPINGADVVRHLRAGLEGLISKHFGGEIIDKLFSRLEEKSEDLSHLQGSSFTGGSLMFLVLKRK
ncbi:loganic acid O-methyltransferase-like [Punica granatum]|uniref:Uncharacterized protein n=2 Tax=Punica granatum TaxID=22663 RepID=A0A218WX33_PUNGR|nr:loganic acid O-methyltransferase-like [Punica granatum]OWM76920.1 hypothetical protein CDL15_Pgr021202 [Punica granatum]PKI61397.1 hypothetical protein CRG98_018205 [Punica granatum]